MARRMVVMARGSPGAGSAPCSPARSWTLGGKDNFVADQAVAGQVAAAQARVSGPGPCLACPQAALLLASLPTRRGPVWCEGQALPADGAAGADGLRPRDLIQGRTSVPGSGHA